MTDWNGAFLRKHVVGVVLTDERPPDADDNVERGEAGYFIVTFDHGESGSTDHAGGTYVYPASAEKARDFREGKLDPTEFYGW